jgi:antibiotic biosynthesis monooxygenase (ABM) superfamily enzyme
MPSLRFALRLWTCVWVLVSALSALLQMFSAQWPLLLRTFTLSVMMVPLMIYLIIPALKKREHRAHAPLSR